LTEELTNDKLTLEQHQAYPTASYLVPFSREEMAYPFPLGASSRKLFNSKERFSLHVSCKQQQQAHSGY
jgi:hypothetical protein